MTNKKRIIGLDISSSTIGWALIEEQNNKFNSDGYGFYKPEKNIELFESLYKVREWVFEILDKTNPDDIVLEDISEHFSVAGSEKGRSTSKTIIKLAVYNRTVGLAVYEWLKNNRNGKNPVLINVNTVRSLIKPKGYRGRLSKEDVPEVVSSILKINFPWEYKRTGKPKDENYDMADAIAVALAYRALQISGKK